MNAEERKSLVCIMSAQISHVLNGPNFKSLHFHGSLPEDIAVSVTDRTVKISGIQKLENSKFSYSFILPRNVQAGTVKSRFLIDDNLLKITW